MAVLPCCVLFPQLSSGEDFFKPNPPPKLGMDIDNRYFWIKDRLESENIQVQHCPTDKMIADFFTKHLQGNLFRRFRDIILGYKHISAIHEEDTSDEHVSIQERVGKNDGSETVKKDGNNTSSNNCRNPNVSWADVVKNNNS